MQIRTFETRRQLAEAAAQSAAEILQNAIRERGRASFIVATGNSQLDFLAALTAHPGIDWSKTTLFHLDEYIDLPKRHPASFSEYIRQKVLARVHPGEVHLLDEEDANHVASLLLAHIIDVAFVGIGENGHLAFNDPPADFETREPYIKVALDEKCRRQQVGEGWFKTMDDVPREATSMSVRQILASREILCIVPEKRKAEAVRDCFTGGVTPLHPASILQEHPHTTVFLDRDSASLLN
jgi:glucosamine-6-phosphate deaminase